VFIPAAEDRGIPKPFSIGKYAVTNVEYAQFVEERGCPAPDHWQEGGYPLQQANHPVTYVSLQDARAYCEWFSQRAGRTFRLPSATEWIAAAREDEPDRRYPWGNRMDQQFLNWRKNVGGTTPVGIYIEGETERGVADLMGNVWEWTLDRQGMYQILKGGGWDTLDLEEGIDTIRKELPSVRQANIGFRIVEV
jgi:formylglycine-generating enzyme required for sulfatase activity